MLDTMLIGGNALDKNKTQKKDKSTYRPWRHFNSCYGCGRSLKDYPKEETFCDACHNKISMGYEIC